MIKRILLWLLAFFASPTEAQPSEKPAAWPAAYVIPPDFAPRCPGAEFEMGGQRFIIAPLTATVYEQFKQQLFDITSIPEMGLVADLAFHCLRRNYPDITREQVLELVDRSNFLLLWEHIMDAAGLLRQAGEMQRRMESAAKTHAA